MVISDPTKSWAIYAELHEGGEAQYYKLHLEEGDRLRASLYIPLVEKGFMPKLVIMGPGISSKDAIPEFVEVPEGVGIILLESRKSERPEYEPFTPSSYYYLADFDLEITIRDDYYLAIFDPSRGGRYGLATGYREVFGIDEWLLVPIDVLSIREWEGQSQGIVLAPLIAAVAVGFLVLIWLKKDLLGTLRVWTISAAGFLYLGSGFMMILQMLIALSVTMVDLSVILTLFFAILPVLLGLMLIKSGIRETLNSRARILIAVFGLLGLVTWSGLLVGPILAILSSILPSKRITTKNK